MSAVHSSLNNTHTHTQALSEPAPAQNGEGSSLQHVTRDFLRCTNDGDCMAAFRRAITPAGLQRQSRRPAPAPAPALAPTTTTTTASAPLHRRINGHPRMVTTRQLALRMEEARRSAAAASPVPVPTPAPVPTPVPTSATTTSTTTTTAASATTATTTDPDPLPQNSDSHPLLQPLLDYAERYASGVRISGYILTRTQEAEAVLFALGCYEILWGQLHSVSSLLSYEGFFDDIESIRAAVVAVQTRLRAEGAFDQLVLAEALEERLSIIFSKKHSPLLPKQASSEGRVFLRQNQDARIPQAEDGMELLNTHTFFDAPPPASSALPHAHAAFLSQTLENSRDWLRRVMLNDRNHAVGSPLPDDSDLDLIFVRIRINEQILSYICRMPGALDSFSLSYRQFTQLSTIAQRRMIQQMQSVIKRSPPLSIEAALRDTSGKITSYLTSLSSSCHYRKFVAENLLVQLIDDVFLLMIGEAEVRFYKKIGLKRLYWAIPRLQDQLNSLMEQFRRDGLSDERLRIVESLGELLSIIHIDCRAEFGIKMDAPNRSISESLFPSPARCVPIYQGPNFVHFVARCQRQLAHNQQLCLQNTHEGMPPHAVRLNFITARACSRILAYLNNVRNHPAAPPLADIPVAILPPIVSSAPSTVASETTNASITESIPSPPTAPTPNSESSTTTTLSTTEPESPPPSANTTTTTTTTVAVRSRSARAPAPAPAPRKTSREQTWENITLAELRRLNPQELLQLFNAMEFSLVSGRGSHKKVVDKTGHVVGVWPRHPKKEGLSRTVAGNLLAAVKSNGKEKQH